MYFLETNHVVWYRTARLFYNISNAVKEKHREKEEQLQAQFLNSRCFKNKLMARSDLNLQSLCCSEIILLKKATPTIETKNQIVWSMGNPENPFKLCVNSWIWV